MSQLTPSLSPSSSGCDTSLTAPANEALRASISSFGLRIGEAGTRLFAALPEPVKSPGDLVRVLGLNKSSASRLMIAFAKQDPLALVYYLPGVDCLKKVGDLASARGAESHALQRWVEVVNEFGTFLHEKIGGKQELNALASGVLEDARRRFEMTNRQALYKANTNLLGAMCEIALQTTIVYPSAGDPARADDVQIEGVIGFRRLRTGDPIILFSNRHSRSQRPLPPGSVKTLNGRRPGTAGTSLLLEKYCSKPLPELITTDLGIDRVHKLVGDDVGLDTACDLYLSEYITEGMSRWFQNPRNKVGIGVCPEVPAQRLVFDVLVHKDIWPGVEPEFWSYRPTWRGFAHPDDASRDSDRMKMFDEVVSLEHGMRSCWVLEVPSYIEAIKSVCELRSWDATSFRGYRCDIRYPVWGMQYCMAFTPGTRDGEQTRQTISSGVSVNGD